MTQQAVLVSSHRAHVTANIYFSKVTAQRTSPAFLLRPVQAHRIAYEMASSTETNPNPPSSTVMTQLRAFIAEAGGEGWDRAWCVFPMDLSDILIACFPSFRKANVTPWDAGDVQPPLRDLILSGELHIPNTGRALVPGCGRVSFMTRNSRLKMLTESYRPVD